MENQITFAKLDWLQVKHYSVWLQFSMESD